MTDDGERDLWQEMHDLESEVQRLRAELDKEPRKIADEGLARVEV